MSSTIRPAPAAPRSRRRLLLGVLAAFILLLAAGVAGLYWVDYDLRHPKPDSGRPGAWMTVDRDEVSGFAHVTVPVSAQDVRWGYQNGFQDDFAVLAFRIPQDELEEYKSSLPASEWTDRQYVQRVDLDGFQHIGAPAPSTTSPLTCGGFYTPGKAKNIGTRICLTSRSDGTSQVWVSAFHTP
ncbi:hypothetical protein [Kitasatospora purpeofusca]|uniref:hypothetical protein n=1 Tax=Kitasatospora purpeofusca TaxID=67352 RepID=UPI000B0770A1|nr:hypothetical protein [Kitasatospora purpeofusca]